MRFINSVLAILLLAGCSSAGIPAVKTQAYAAMPNEKTFEYEFYSVWKAIEEVVRNMRVVERDPSEVDTGQLRRLTERSLKTDWVYTQSKDKYQEYTVNGSPRKTYLQAKVRYKIEAKRVLGGVQVVVTTEEEVEKMRTDGTSAGWSKSDNPDPSRASGVIDQIHGAILAAPSI